MSVPEYKSAWDDWTPESICDYIDQEGNKCIDGIMIKNNNKEACPSCSGTGRAISMMDWLHGMYLGGACTGDKIIKTKISLEEEKERIIKNKEWWIEYSNKNLKEKNNARTN